MSACLPPRLALVGLRGAGKTSVGRRVAESTGAAFIDLDERIADAAGMSRAGEVIERRGLAAFRSLEREHLAQVTAEPRRLVLSTGGGAVEDEGSRQLLRTAFVTIWLRAPLKVLIERVRADESDAAGAALRPSILSAEGHPEFVDAGSLEAEFALLAERRTPLYREVARRAVDVESLDPQEIAGRVKEIWLG